MRSIARYLSFITLAFMAFMMGCGGSSTVAPVPPAEPTITSFTSDKSTIGLGKSALITAVYANGAGTVTPGVGPVPSGQAVAVTPQATTSYILTVTNSAGSTAQRTLTVTVAPPITGVKLTASKKTIQLGESVELLATFSGGTAKITNSANGDSITPTANVPNLVKPDKTTTYTLTVTNAAGETATDGCLVTVENAPTITNLTANPATISQGETSTLAYTFSGGTGAINSGVGPVYSGLTTAVTPSVTTTYQLTVTSPSGATAVSAVTVTVRGNPSNLNLRAERNTITIGDSVRLTADWNAGDALVTNTLDSTVVMPVKGVPFTVTPQDNVTYILTVTNAAGGSSTVATTITVVPMPVITNFTGMPATVTKGNSAELLPIFKFGTGSINQNIGPVLTGVPVKVSPALETSYLLTVTNAAGAFVQRSFTVKVVEPPAGISLVAIPPIVSVGSPSKLVGTFTAGTASVDQGIGQVMNGVPVLVTPPGGEGFVTVTTYTMTVINPAGASATTGATITVVPHPVITSFTQAYPGYPLNPSPAGADVVLSPVFEWGTGYITGVGSVVSGDNYIVNPRETTTYTLTVTNPAGDSITRVLTVNVVGDPVIESFGAFPSTITDGDYSQLIGIFSGGDGVITAEPRGRRHLISSGAVSPFPASGIPVISGVSEFVDPGPFGPDFHACTYTLTVTSASGIQVHRSCTVLLVGEPLATSLEIAPGYNNPITLGQSTRLVPTFSGGTAVITPDVGTVISGNLYAVNPKETTTYTLAVTNSIGAVDRVTLTVVVLTGPSAAALTAKPEAITVGDNTYLTGYFTLGSAEPGSPVVPSATVTGPTNGYTGTELPMATPTLLNAVPFRIMPAAVGTYVYTMSVTNGAGVTSTHGTTVRVYERPTAALGMTPIPPASFFKQVITKGETTSITPVFPTGCTGTIAGIGTVTSGQAYPVTPGSTTTYVLTVTNPAGATATASLTITVLDGPFASAFYFQPAIITEGDTTQLYALFSNATSAQITHNAGTKLTPASPILTGAITSGTPIAVVSAPATPAPGSQGLYTYTLAVTNAAATTYTTTTNLTVVPAPAGVALNVSSPDATPFTAPYTITAGQRVVLAPVFTGGTGAISQGVGPVVSGSTYVVTPTVSTTYTLTVTNAAGRAVTVSQTIFVVSGPYAQALVGDPAVVTTNDYAYLTAVFNLPTGGTATVDSSTSGADGTGKIPYATPDLKTGVPFRIRPTTPSWAGVKLYTLTVSSGTGVSNTTGFALRVVDPPTQLVLAREPAEGSIAEGETITLTPSWVGGSDCVGVLSGGGMSMTVTSGTSYSFPLWVTTNFVLTVTNAAGTSASVSQTIVVVRPPVITDFYAVPAIITAGDSTNLFATFSNATVGPNQITPGPIAVTSGVPTTVTPLATTTYVLTVVGNGGSASRATMVTVVPAPICTITAPAGPYYTRVKGLIASVPFQTGATYAWTITNGTITAGQGTNQVTFTVGTNTAVNLVLGVTVTNSAGTSCTSSVSRNVNPPPALTSSLASSDADDTITLGSSVNLTPTFGGGVNPVAVLNPTVGTVLSGVAYTVSPTVTTTYTLVVTDDAGQTQSSATRTITVIQPVSITSFTASKNPVTVGTMTELTAVFSNPTPAVNGNQITYTGAVGNPASPIVPSSGSVLPYVPSATGNQVFTLTETNLSGQTVSRQFTLNVVPAVGAISLTADHTTITKGQTALLTPTFTVGTGNINHSVGLVTSGTDYAVMPTETTTYTLRVTNAAGDVSSTQLQIVVVDGPFASAFYFEPSVITAGDYTNLFAFFQNADTAVVNSNAFGSPVIMPFSLMADFAVSNGEPVEAFTNPDPLDSAGVWTHTLTLTNTTSGTTANKVANLTILPAPTAQLVVTNPLIPPYVITPGQSVTLVPSWTLPIPAVCTGTIDHGVGTVLNGTSYVVWPTTSTTYTLTVTNAAGYVSVASVDVIVVSGPLAISFKATPQIITEGSSTLLEAIFANGNGEINPGANAVVNGEGLSVSPAATQTYYLTVTQPDTGISETRATTVVVVPVPVALINGSASFGTSVTAGTPVPLTMGVQDGIGTLVGHGTVADGQIIVVIPTVTTTYLLEVTNAAGTTVSAVYTVIVVEGPFAQALETSKTLVTTGETYVLTPHFTTGVGITASLSGTAAIPAVNNHQAYTRTAGAAGTTETWSLNVTNGLITRSTGVDVTVVAAPTATITGTAYDLDGTTVIGPPLISPANVQTGRSVGLRFTFTGAPTAEVEALWMNGATRTSTTTTVATASELRYIVPTPGDSVVITLKVTNAAGTTVVRTFTIIATT